MNTNGVRPIKSFQVDPIPSLIPYTFEKDAIRAMGGELAVGDCNTEADVLAQAQDAEILLLSWKPILTPDVMHALPNARLIIRWGVGYDMIDVAAATERGIAVANTPSYATEDVAEHAIALLMNCARRVAWFHERVRKGEFPYAMTNPIYRIAGKTLGLIGLGRIGTAVARRARGLGLRVSAHDTHLDDDLIRARGAEPRTFEQVLSESDFVSIHVPLNGMTKKLMDAAAIATMKPGAYLINTSRGPVLDEAALRAALERGHLAGAGLDVFEQEPLPADSPLRKMEHVVLTPHMAAYSEESWQALRQEMCDTIAAWMRDGWSAHIVNPEVRAHLRARRVRRD